MDISKFFRETILKIKPYIPGKPIDEVKRELGIDDVIKLASNENPLGMSPKAREKILEIYKDGFRYPDDAAYLKDKLAKRNKIKPENIMLGNGSVELIDDLLLAFLEPDDEVITSIGAFIMYHISCVKYTGKSIQIPMAEGYRHDLPAMLKAITPKTKIIVIVNPNNPTGSLLTRSEIKEFMDKVGDDILIIFDEAYYEYVKDSEYPNTIDEYLLDRPNVIILRTFSKIYGLAGLRVGYGFADIEIINYMKRVQLPFNVGYIAQRAAYAALDDDDFIEKTRLLNAKGREYFYKEFERLGLNYVKSYANFVLVDIEQNAKVAYEKMMNKGVIIRPMTGYGFPTHLRINTGSAEQNKRIISELEKLLMKS